jgi:hypothetical protein
MQDVAGLRVERINTGVLFPNETMFFDADYTIKRFKQKNGRSPLSAEQQYLENI